MLLAWLILSYQPAVTECRVEKSCQGERMGAAASTPLEKGSDGDLKVKENIDPGEAFRIFRQSP